MKILFKSLLITIGTALSFTCFAQSDLQSTSPADSTNMSNKRKMRSNEMHSDSMMHMDKGNKMDKSRLDSIQMNDRRSNPSTIPADSTRNRKSNERMMQRDSLN